MKIDYHHHSIKKHLPDFRILEIRVDFHYPNVPQKKTVSFITY